MSVIENFCKIYTDICQISPADLENIYSKRVTFVDPITTHEGIEQVKTYFNNLLTQAESCKFLIHNTLTIADPNSPVSHVVNWKMTLVLKRSTKVITLDGTTQLKVEDEKIIYHKDYYDLGEMVYEHIPLLGSIIKMIKRRLAK